MGSGIGSWALEVWAGIRAPSQGQVLEAGSEEGSLGRSSALSRPRAGRGRGRAP